MAIVIAGKTFDLDPLEKPFDNRVEDRHFASEISRFQLYLWDCTPPEPSGRYLLRLGAGNKLNLGNIVEFQEHDGDSLLTSPNRTKTALMKIKVLGALGANSVNDLKTAVNRFFGKHHVSVDLSKFDWLKPFASFAVWVDVRYFYYEVSNATLGLKFYIGLPHSVSLTADIIKICNSEGLKTALEGGRSMDAVSLGLTEGGKTPSRVERRRYLRQRKRWLRGILGTGGGDIFGHIRAELEEIEAELRDLEKD